LFIYLRKLLITVIFLFKVFTSPWPPSKGELWKKTLQRGNYGKKPFKGGIMEKNPSKGEPYGIIQHPEPCTQHPAPGT
jgi:hypothetical protein